MQESYNTGDYINAVVDRQRAENISSILYPDDRSYQVFLLFLYLINYIKIRLHNNISMRHLLQHLLQMLVFGN